MDEYCIFEILLGIIFLYSIFDVKKQYKKYKGVKNNNNTYKEVKLLISEISAIVIGTIYLILLIMGI